MVPILIRAEYKILPFILSSACRSVGFEAMSGTDARGIILNQTQQRHHDWPTLEELEIVIDSQTTTIDNAEAS